MSDLTAKERAFADPTFTAQLGIVGERRFDRQRQIWQQCFEHPDSQLPYGVWQRIEPPYQPALRTPAASSAASISDCSAKR